MPPPVVVRNYPAQKQSEATAAFQTEASRMSAEGYRPTSQSWSPPGLNASALLGWLGVICIIAGLVLYLPALVLGVILLLIGALIPNPKGELTVTFQRQ